MNEITPDDRLVFTLCDPESPKTKNAHAKDQEVIANADGFTLIFGSCELFHHVDPNDYMWEGDGKREVRVPIFFEKPLERKPHVFLSINSLDSSQAHNLRYKILAEDVSKNGFTAAFKTWSDTRISSASISWVAFSQSVESRVKKLMGDNY